MLLIVFYSINAPALNKTPSDSFLNMTWNLLFCALLLKIREKARGGVNQLDAGNEKDQNNSSGSYNPQTQTSKNSKNKTR